MAANASKEALHLANTIRSFIHNELSDSSPEEKRCALKHLAGAIFQVQANPYFPTEQGDPRSFPPTPVPPPPEARATLEEEQEAAQAVEAHYTRNLTWANHAAIYGDTNERLLARCIRIFFLDYLAELVRCRLGKK